MRLATAILCLLLVSNAHAGAWSDYQQGRAARKEAKAQAEFERRFRVMASKSVVIQAYWKVRQHDMVTIPIGCTVLGWVLSLFGIKVKRSAIEKWLRRKTVKS